MPKTLPIHDFLILSKTNPVLDVRSPSEYKQGHIPEAHNLSLFSDEERAEVGTLYKQSGRKAAILKGLEFTGAKMKHLVEQAMAINRTDIFMLHCWRGGKRSSSVAWLLNLFDFQIYILEGGYKSFRNHVLTSFSTHRNWIILGGFTGSGKTELLHQLQQAANEPIIDLEALANHKGSAFGALGMQPQPSTEHFENQLFHHIQKYQPNEWVWLEDESLNIGSVSIPKNLIQQMRAMPVIFIKVPKPERIKRLVQDYGIFPPEKLAEAISKIERKLGGLQAKKAMDALYANDLEAVADILLTYYDKMYLTSLKTHHSPKNIIEIETDGCSTAEIVAKLVLVKQELMKNSANLFLPILNS